MWCAVKEVLESRHFISRQNICQSWFTSKDYILSFRRVWFWLRTNAGGVDKTCKSNEILSKACFAKSSGERVSNTWATCPEAGDKPPKGGLIPYVIPRGISWTLKGGIFGPLTSGWARGLSACWWGNGSPRQRRVTGLRGWSVTLELRHGPDTYGWQQSRIIHNGRKPDGATPRGGWQP